MVISSNIHILYILSHAIGAQNCMDGTDEENCDEVEMNECTENEFRCQNGLCIPEEYWLDGKLEILIYSDICRVLRRTLHL
jgi:hypothetical protein